MRMNLQRRLIPHSLSPHVGLSDLGDDLTRLLERLQHLRRLLPPLADVFTLGEETLDLIRLVEAGNQLALEVVLYEVYHEVHYSLKAMQLMSLVKCPQPQCLDVLRFAL